MSDGHAQGSNTFEMTKMDQEMVQAVESPEDRQSSKQRSKFRLYMIVAAEFVSNQCSIPLISD